MRYSAAALFFTLSFFVLAGCGTQAPKRMTSGDLRIALDKALSGDSLINMQLGGLFADARDLDGYHRVALDSIILDSARFFAAVIEHRFPQKSLFAVYDSAGNLKLLQRGLNGTLSLKAVTFKDAGYFLTGEDYIERGTILLKKMNIFYAGYDTVTSALRFYEGLFTPKERVRSAFWFISKGRLVRSYEDMRTPAAVKTEQDTFLFNSILCKFVSAEDKVGTRLAEILKNYPDHTRTMLLHKHLSDSVQVEQTRAGEMLCTFFYGKLGLYLPEGFTVMPGNVVAEFIKPVEGATFRGDGDRSAVYIFLLPSERTFSEYMPDVLRDTVKGGDLIVSSGKILSGENYKNYLTIVNGNTKFGVLLEVPKALYKENPVPYDFMLQSLTITK